jgi:hypothetical protein
VSYRASVQYFIIVSAICSTIGTAEWRGAAGIYLPNSPAVGHLYSDCAAAVTMRRPKRQPSDHELRALRTELLALANDLGDREPSTPAERLAAHVVQCAEFFSAAGTRDLLFHPQERTYTLSELGDMLADCSLECFGVTFGSLVADANAQRAYAAVHASADDQRVVIRGRKLLERWHAVELAHPGTFGRMHRLNCRAL